MKNKNNGQINNRIYPVWKKKYMVYSDEKHAKKERKKKYQPETKMQKKNCNLILLLLIKMDRRKKIQRVNVAGIPLEKVCVCVCLS